MIQIKKIWGKNKIREIKGEQVSKFIWTVPMCSLWVYEIKKKTKSKVEYDQ